MREGGREGGSGREEGNESGMGESEMEVSLITYIRIRVGQH